MCKRNHAAHHMSKVTGRCRLCGAMRTAAWRGGIKVKPVHRYELNRSAVPKRRLDITVALAAVPMPTWNMWYYKNVHTGRPSKTDELTARTVARNLNVPFEVLWHEI